MTHQPALFGQPQTQTTSDDHYTPKWVFDALDVTFDIDVSAPPGGIPWIPCKKYYTMQDDGLSQAWHGLIWMNPPYSNSEPWVNRFIEHGNGIALLPIVKGWWFSNLWNHPDTRCLLGCEPGRDRMKFHHGDKMKEIMFHVMFWAIGDQAITALKRLGRTR